MSLYSQTKQVFSFTYNKSYTISRGIGDPERWNMDILYRNLVQKIEVKSNRRNDMVRLDRTTLRLCPKLKILRLSPSGLEDTETQPLGAIEKAYTTCGSLNSANDAIFVSRLSEMTMDGSCYDSLQMKMRQIRGILGSKHRRFNVMVGI